MTTQNETRPPLEEEIPEIDHEAGARFGKWVLTAIVAVLLVGSVVTMFLPLVSQAIGTAAIILMLLLIFLRVPVGFAMIIPSCMGMYALYGAPAVDSMLRTLPYDETASWSLSVLPMFILMGLLMWRSGITDSLYRAGRLWLNRAPGGLAVGTNLAGAGLASVSGSTIATTFALARIGIPEMLKAGYDKRLAIGSVIVAGLPGQLIPPSIMMVLYAGIVEVPVGPQLIAGVGPGILVAVVFSIALMIFARKWSPPTGTGLVDGVVPTWGMRFRELGRIWPVPILIVVILGGMLMGIFTATEAGAVAAFIALLLTFFWKRKEQPLTAVAQASTGAVSSVGAIFLMLIGVEMLSRMLSTTGISTLFAQWVGGWGVGRVEFLLLMMLVYFVLGAFMEPLTMMVLTIPILMPTLASLDISLMWFGVFVIFMGELAILTPPVGILTFILHSIIRDPEVNGGQKITLSDIFKTVGWFMPFAILVAVLLILFPEIATWLPGLANEPM